VQTLETTIVALRCKTSPLALAVALRQKLGELDPNLPIFDIATMDQRLASELAAPRFNATLLGIFAGFALLLAVVGIYGVMAYFAAQRTHEIGIRMALGALPGSILRLLMGEAVATTLFGLAMGLAGALAVTRYLASLLFKIRPVDPVTFAVVCLVIAAVAVGASYLPARRATKVDPLVALRYE
jgi:putative ABC transport system permease protein